MFKISTAAFITFLFSTAHLVHLRIASSLSLPTFTSSEASFYSKYALQIFQFVST